MNPGEAAFRLSFQLSPIIFTNGIAENIPGKMLPIIAITEAINFTQGLLSGPENIDLDDFFANFEPLPGSSLVDNQIGNYPFANQAVAANAIIAQPLTISLRMVVPVRQSAGYKTKLATMIALQTAISAHNNSGGTYVIATPSFFYTDCIMTGMKDASGGNSKQVQNAWQLDFVKPLLTVAQAQISMNSLMSKISSQTALDGAPAWSGLSATTPASLATIGLVPASSGPAGAGTAGFGP